MFNGRSNTTSPSDFRTSVRLRRALAGFVSAVIVLGTFTLPTTDGGASTTSIPAPKLQVASPASASSSPQQASIAVKWAVLAGKGIKSVTAWASTSPISSKSAPGGSAQCQGSAGSGGCNITSGLTSGVQYFIGARATGTPVKSGEPAPFGASASEGPITAYSAALPQVTLTATQGSIGQTVALTALDNGSGPISSFPQGVAVSPNSWGEKCSSSGTAKWTCTNLVPQISYRFQISATNAEGTSTGATSSQVLPDPGRPMLGTPTAITSGSSTATISVPFTSTASSGSFSMLTNPPLATLPSCGGSASQGVFSGSCSVSGAASHTQYQLVVEQTNASPQLLSSVGSVTTPTSGLAIQPASSSVSNGVESIAFGWTDPAQVAGTTSYTCSGVTKDPNAPSVVPQSVTPTSSSGNHCTLTGLRPLDGYQLSVTSSSGVTATALLDGSPASVTAASDVTGGKTTVAYAFGTYGIYAPGTQGASISINEGSAVVGATTSSCGAASGQQVATTPSSSLNPLTVQVTPVECQSGFPIITGLPTSTVVPGVDVLSRSSVQAGPVSYGPGGDKITLSWNLPASGPVPTESASDGVAGSCPSPSINGNQASVTCINLTPGHGYTFTLTSTSGSNTSTSSLGGVTPFTYPSPPTNVTATVLMSDAGSTTNGQVQLSWTAGDNGGSPLTGYVVELKDLNASASTAGGCQAAGGSATSTTCTGLTKGHHYQFSVQSSNAPGVFSLSPGLSPSTVVYGAPAVPSSLKVATNDPSNSGKVTLAWANPTDVGSAPGGITGYTITYGSGAAVTTLSLSAAQVSTQCTTLVGDHCYTFTPNVSQAPTWTISVSNGFASPSVSLTPPGAPTVSAVVGKTVVASSIGVQWTAEPAATNYQAFAWADGTSFNSAGPPCSSASTSCAITGLVPGTSYHVAVEASQGGTFTSADSVTWGFLPSTVIPITTPNAPANLNVNVDSGNGTSTMTATWNGDTVASAGGSSSWEYTCSLQYATTTVGSATSSANQTNCSFVANPAPVPSPSCSTGIYLGCQYTLSVKTTNDLAAGDGFTSAASSSAPTPFPASPVMEGAPTVTAISGGIQVNYDVNDRLGKINDFPIYAVPFSSLSGTTAQKCADPTSWGDSAPQQCGAQYFEGSAPGVVGPSENQNSTVLSSNLQFNSTYVVTVRAVNNLGASNWTSYSDPITFASGPTGGTISLQNTGSGTQLQVTIASSGEGDTQLNLWGVDPSHLEISVNLNGSQTFTCTAQSVSYKLQGLQSTGGPIEPFCEIPNLTANQLDSVAVTASDGVGNSLNYPTIPWFMAGPIGAPTINSETMGSGSTISVNFNPATLAPGDQIGSYQVEAEDAVGDGALISSPCPTTPANGTITCSVGGAVPGLTYAVWVVATDAYGATSPPQLASQGICSNSAEANTCEMFTMGTPAPATNIVATTVNGALQVSWIPGLVNGFPITRSVVKVLGVGTTCASTTGTPSCVFSQNAVGANPTVQVTEYASILNPVTNTTTEYPSISAPAALSWTPPPLQPGAPTGLTLDPIQTGSSLLTKSGNGFVVWWNAPTVNASSVSFYRVSASLPGSHSAVAACSPTNAPVGGHYFCVLSHLTIAQYTVQVVAVDAFGDQSAQEQETLLDDPSMPWRPTAVTGFADPSGGVTVTFKTQDPNFAEFSFLTNAASTSSSAPTFQCKFAGTTTWVSASANTCHSSTAAGTVTLQASRTVGSTTTSTPASIDPQITIGATTGYVAPSLGAGAAIGGAANSVTAAALSADGLRLYSLDPTSAKVEVATLGGSSWSANLVQPLPTGVNFALAKDIVVQSATNSPNDEIFVTFTGSSAVAELVVAKSSPTVVVSSLVFTAPTPTVTALSVSPDGTQLELCSASVVDAFAVSGLANGVVATPSTSTQLPQACTSMTSSASGAVFVLAGGYLFTIVGGNLSVAMAIEPNASLGTLRKLVWAGSREVLGVDSKGNLLVLLLPSQVTASQTQPSMALFGAAVSTSSVKSLTGGAFFAVSGSTIAWGTPSGTVETVGTIQSLG